MSKYNCSVCGVNSTKPECFRHTKRQPLKKSFIKQKPKSEEKIKQEKEDSEKMRAFFFYLWQTQPRQSEIFPYTKFYGEVKNYYYHHLKPKSRYKEVQYSVMNILRCTGNEHTMIESNNDYYPIVKERIKFIEENYDLCKKQSDEWEEEYNKNKFV